MAANSFRPRPERLVFPLKVVEMTVETVGLPALARSVALPLVIASSVVVGLALALGIALRSRD